MKNEKEFEKDVMSLLTHLDDIVRNRTGTWPSRDKRACFYAMAVLTCAVGNLAAHFKGKKPEVKEVKEIYKKIVSAGPVIFSRLMWMLSGYLTKQFSELKKEEPFH